MLEVSCIQEKNQGRPTKSLLESNRKYRLNEAAFEVITDEAAYWLGFIMADGCISYEYRYSHPSSPRLRINLSPCDMGHLQKLKDFLGYEGIIALRDNGRYCALEITSSQLVESLAQYGVVERKSRTASVMELNNNLHFWRGLIDGDGTLYLSKYMYPSLSLCGSENILNQFVDYVKNNFPEIQKISIRKCASIKQLSIAGEKAITLTKHFYLNCPVALDRKWRKAEIIMNLRKEQFSFWKYTRLNKRR
jgi:hypothetical protein